MHKPCKRWMDSLPPKRKLFDDTINQMAKLFGRAEWKQRRTPVLTSDNMIRSFNANVSPCFILMRFLSKHFIAYLFEDPTKIRKKSRSFRRTEKSRNQIEHFAGISFATPINFSEAAAADDSMHAEIVHGQLNEFDLEVRRMTIDRTFYLNVQFEVLPLTKSAVFLWFDEFVEYLSAE